MAIDSLGSATNSNFQSGPSINGTGRMDGNTGTALVPAEYKPGDNALDAFRHELLLSRRSAQHHAYVNVISRDSTPCQFSHGVTVAVDDPVLSFGTGCLIHASMVVDQSIETYFADLGDARTELEYYLAHHQVSLHGLDNNLHAGLRNVQPGLNRGVAPAHTRRRNAIMFLDEVGVDNGAMHAHQQVDVHNVYKQVTPANPYVFYRGTNAARTSSGKDGMTVFVPMLNADWLRDTQTKHAFKRTLLTILHDMFENTTEYKPQVTTARSKANYIEAPEFRYAGLALTDAHMHPSMGDTAVTVNHYSALTTQNGPYDVYIGDDLGWVFNIERNNILPDGNRVPRVALTYSVLQQLMVDRVTRGAIGANHDERTAVRAQIQRDTATHSAARQRATAAVPANSARLGELKSSADSERSKYPRFVLVPLRHGSGIAKRASIMDRQRRIGKAIGSCKGYGRLDWVNGASSEM